ncbi:hypothetical protein [Ornithinimicrobium panacihumi]|uniref:hypothetical protein n=1 Tax=Ornithinimicrobium panacihumi TaxID=2008449 RepID=UPI003F8C39AB
MADGFIWGDASVTYPDWVGTAQLDERKTAAQVEEVVGLDHKEWLVIGLDLGGGEDGGHELRVVAVHRDNVPEGGDVLPRIAAANNGEIPVTEFLIHDKDPYEVLQAITHSFELRLRLSLDPPTDVVEWGVADRVGGSGERT